MTAPPAGYRVIAWDATTVLAGTLRGAHVDLPVSVTGFRDLRACSAPADGSWAAATGVDATTGAHVLWRVDLVGGGADPLLEAGYLLYPAVDRTGTLVAYTAPAARDPQATSLYVLDVGVRESRLLVEATVARSSVPSWRGADRILFHTGAEVAEVDLSSAGARTLFVGEYPAASPDGGRIAYRAGQAVLVAGEGGGPVDISPRQGLVRRPYRGAMSWSPDATLLLVGRTGGTLGYERDFGTIDVETRAFTRIRRRYLQGITFY